MWSAYPAKAAWWRAVCRDWGDRDRRPPNASPCHSYPMPASARVDASASRPNCGCRREPGNRRTSITAVTPASRSTATSSSAVRVPCPTVYSRGDSSVSGLHLHLGAHVHRPPPVGLVQPPDDRLAYHLLPLMWIGDAVLRVPVHRLCDQGQHPVEHRRIFREALTGH